MNSAQLNDHDDQGLQTTLRKLSETGSVFVVSMINLVSSSEASDVDMYFLLQSSKVQYQKHLHKIIG